jgi:hypothetical protein
MSGERKWDVQFRNPGNFDDEVRVDATDAVAAEANCREYLTSLFPEITIDGWEILSVKEAEIVIDTDDLPRPSYEDAENAIGEFIIKTVGMGPWYELHEDGNGWQFWILESDTTSYLHADMSIEWYGTSWEPGCEDDEEDAAPGQDQDRFAGLRRGSPSFLQVRSAFPGA